MSKIYNNKIQYIKTLNYIRINVLIKDCPIDFTACALLSEWEVGPPYACKQDTRKILHRKTHECIIYKLTNKYIYI